MTGRLNVSHVVVAPWELPDIDTSAAQSPAPSFCETVLGENEAKGAESAAATPLNDLVPKSGASNGEAADAHLAAAHVDAVERGLREGREQGYAAGLAAGRQAAEAQVADRLRSLAAIVQRLGEPTRALERPVEDAVIALALEVARWVIGSEISRSRDFLLALIRDALAKIPIDVGKPAIILHSTDADFIRENAPELESNGVVLIADDTVEPGGCRVIANDAEGVAAKDRRWHPRALQGICEVDLTLASRWRDAMFAMFEGEDT